MLSAASSNTHGHADRRGCTSWVPRGTHPKLRSINGAYGPTDDVLLAGVEADLDFQVAIPLIWPQKSVLFQTDDEWYQQDQTQPTTRYPGFFNSLSPYSYQ